MATEYSCGCGEATSLFIVELLLLGVTLEIIKVQQVGGNGVSHLLLEGGR